MNFDSVAPTSTVTHCLKKLMAQARGTELEGLVVESITALSAKLKSLNAAVYSGDNSREESPVSYALAKIAAATNQAVGKDFFDSLVTNLSKVLNVACAYVAEITDDTDTEEMTSIIAISMHGKRAEPFEYALAGTPCEQVYRNGFSFTSSGVALAYPKDVWLEDNNVESYSGVVLVNAQDDIIGHICVADTHPMYSSDDIRAVLRIFAARAAAELERQRLFRNLEASNMTLKKALDELQTAEKGMARVERFKTMGELSGSLAHNFNNYLASILAHTDNLLSSLDNFKDAGEAEKSLAAIHQVSWDAAEIVKRFQKVFHCNERKNEPRTVLNISSLIEDVLTIIHAKWQKQALAAGVDYQITKQLGKELFVSVQPADLREALMNILLNAFDAMPHGGDLLIKAERQSTNVVVEIKDSGDGMDEETRHQCFEPFFSTKAEKGSGLGLSIAFSTMQRFSGSIEVDSSLGQGATFRISLPHANTL